MEISTYVIILAGILAFSFGIIPYLIATIKGEVQPNKITWLLWSVGLIAVAMQYKNDLLTWASLPILIGGLGPFFIFIASFFNKKSYWKLGIFDYFCGILGVITLFFYFTSKNPALVITFAVLTDAFGAIPTIKKGYTHPNSELIAPYLTFFIFTLISFLGLERFDYNELVFSIYVLILDITMIILLRKQFFELSVVKKIIKIT